jgi:predicted RNase H-like HicB family nuclease
MGSKRITSVVEKTKNGFSAYLEGIDGVVAASKAFDEVKSLLIEALEMHIKTSLELGEPIPEILKGKYEVIFQMDLPSLFEWLSGRISQTGLARIVGINNTLIHQYVTGVKKPGPKQRLRIEQNLHNFASDLQRINL